MMKIRVFGSTNFYGVEKDVNQFLQEKGFKPFQGYKIHYSASPNDGGSIKAYFTVLIEYEDN